MYVPKRYSLETQAGISSKVLKVRLMGGCSHFFGNLAVERSE